jgi:WD40 repeat protein
LPGQPLALAAGPDMGSFLVGCDDGSLARIDVRSAAAETLFAVPNRWIETLAAHPGRARIACGAGRSVHVLNDRGAVTHIFDEHPSAPTGIAFAPGGDALAVSHYNGASIWRLPEAGAGAGTGAGAGAGAGAGGGAEDPAQARSLSWRGSHTGISWSPDGRFVVTATQERELHCWNLGSGRDLRMSGYARKVHAMAWTACSGYLAASGADTVTSWPCDGEGPAGRPPLEFGYAYNSVVSQVAAHPRDATIAGGYDNGTVLVGDIRTGDALIAKAPGGGGVTALAWSSDGGWLVTGCEDGTVTVVAMPKRFRC